MKWLFLLLAAMVLTSCSSNTSSANNAATKEVRTLYLVRHAKSSHDDPTLEDIDRPLNKRGKSDSKLMGELLYEKGVRIDKLLISPSKRTRSTAKRLAKQLDFDKDSIQIDSTIYRCRTQALLEAIRSVDNQYKSLMVIGHNPSTIQVANHFQKDTIFTEVPTCGIVAIEFQGASWETLGHKEGDFKFFDYPKKHKKSDKDKN